MKLWNVTSAIAMGALFVFGCSVENSPTTDGGTTTDTGAKVDTGTATTDTGTATTDTGMMGGDTGNPCITCQQTKCKAEQDACQSSADKLKGCNDLVMCINACADMACANKCVSDSTSAEGKALLTCVQNKCAAECSG